MTGVASPFGQNQTYLERQHPHIVERLRLLWGYPECGEYLADLLVDQRGGRVGFSPEVFSELLALSSRYPALPLGAVRQDSTIPAQRRTIGYGGVHDTSRRRMAV